MTTNYISTVVDADPGKLWSVVRDFSKTEEWYPGVEKLILEQGGKPDQVGVKRQVKMNGDWFTEQLVELSEVKRVRSYRLLEGPFPVENYIGHMRVHPVIEGPGKQAFFEWWTEYDVAPSNREETKAGLQEAYRLGLQGLKEFLTEPGDTRTGT